MPQETRRKIARFDFIKLLRCLEEKKLVANYTLLGLAGGEITIHPKRDELLEAAQQYDVELLTNGFLYNEKVAQLVSRKNSLMGISIDAGTHETFKKVKGFDNFEQVLDNVRKYHDKGGNIAVKYIFVPENSGEEDIRGFVDFCSERKFRSVDLSADVYHLEQANSNSIGDSVVLMTRLLKEKGMQPRFMYFNDASMARFEEEMA